MTAKAADAILEARLPALSGRWVSVYRLIWAILALVAAGLMVASVISGDVHPAILVLRGLKFVVVVTVCSILLRRRASDPVAALLCLAFLTWAITSSFDFAAVNPAPALLDRIRFLLFALALLLFPDGSFRPRWTFAVAVTSTAVCLLGISETIGVFGTRLFLPLAIVCVIAAVASLAARMRLAESEAVQQQLKWVGLGLAAGILLILCARAGAALASASPALRPMPILWEGLFQLGIVIVALGFLVSLLRYRLFDAETAISRSAALAVLTASLVATFAGTEATIEWIGQQYLGMGIGNISATMAAAVAAVLLNPLHSRISSWAEERFQRDLVELKQNVPELLKHLSVAASPEQLGAAILPRINEAVHATRSALVLRRKVVAAEGISRRNAATVHFPARLELGCSACHADGWLLLGPRPDGSLYGADDLDAVRSILPDLRHALEASSATHELRSEVRRVRHDLDRQIRLSTHGGPPRQAPTPRRPK